MEVKGKNKGEDLGELKDTSIPNIHLFSDKGNLGLSKK